MAILSTTKEITSYNFKQITPYFQYKEVPGIQEVCDAINAELEEQLRLFFYQFKWNVDLRSAPEVVRSYSSFYLKYYYGLSEIPDPSNQKFLAKYTYDEANVNYDSKGLDNLDIIYDDLTSSDDKLASYLSPDEFASIAVAILDYSHEVQSLDYVNSILNAYYKANMRESLDFTRCRYSIQEHYILIELPTADTAEAEMWQRFVLINEFNPQLIGLPVGRCVEFRMQSQLTIYASESIVRLWEGEEKEIEVTYSGDTLDIDGGVEGGVTIAEMKEKP